MYQVPINSGLRTRIDSPDILITAASCPWLECTEPWLLVCAIIHTLEQNSQRVGNARIQHGIPFGPYSSLVTLFP